MVRWRWRSARSTDDDYFFASILEPVSSKTRKMHTEANSEDVAKSSLPMTSRCPSLQVFDVSYRHCASSFLRPQPPSLAPLKLIFVVFLAGNSEKRYLAEGNTTRDSVESEREEERNKGNTEDVLSEPVSQKQFCPLKHRERESVFWVLVAVTTVWFTRQTVNKRARILMRRCIVSGSGQADKRQKDW